jgi:multimeric flavodoxin WrbA
VEIMQVLALNSSPRDDRESKTSLLLSRLAAGMTEAGAQVETVELRSKKINPCQGCFTCWTRTPGVCMQPDDMTRDLFPKWLAADLVVYASPLYHYTFNAVMKNFIERTLPYAEPFMVQTDGFWGHPERQQAPPAVVLSVAGLFQMEVFDLLRSYVGFLFGQRSGLKAGIYRTAAEMLTIPAFKDKAREVLEAVQEAGRQVVSRGEVDAATMEAITQPLGKEETLAQVANTWWKTCIDNQLSPRQMDKKGIMPRPESIPALLATLSLGYNPEAAGETEAVIQFCFSGKEGGECYLQIADGTIEALEGSAASPDLTVNAPFETWLDVMSGKLDGQEAFTSGACGAQGDFALLMKLGQMFGGR